MDEKELPKLVVFTNSNTTGDQLGVVFSEWQGRLMVSPLFDVTQTWPS